MDRIEALELECQPCPDCPQWPRCIKVILLMDLGEVVVCKALYIEMLQSVNVPIAEA